MTFVSILETLVLGPLKLLFEFIFQTINMFANKPALSIIALSLIINILVFPLYKRADEMQIEARDIENKLRDGVNHIKKSFSGDERMMMLQTYYRQNNYKPTHALRSTVSLLLQVPFFMAAYGFLSKLQAFDGTPLGPIADLGAPDGLLVIGGISINVLPILMTAINFVSSTIYLKGFPLKNKIQIYAMAIFFLIFLYPSPSGLVFYWTFNNLFSLCKTILYKIKNPQIILKTIATLVGTAICFYALFICDETIKMRVLCFALGLACQVFWFLPLFKKLATKFEKETNAQPDNKLFTIGSCFLTVLVGALISSALIADSPQEFVDVSDFYHPLWYVLSAFCFAAGTFLIWLRVFYWLATPDIKMLFDKLVWVLSGLMIVNYMFFGTNLGNLTNTLRFDRGVSFGLKDHTINIAVMLVLFVVLFFIATKWKKAITSILLVATVAAGVMVGVNIHTINTSISNISVNESANAPHFQLDKEGKNVVVLMMDRAVGSYVPYIFNEKEELKQQFDGFTFYSNTVSFGLKTNFGTPPLMGGYEYTPVEMNKRDSEKLVDKHNEAVLLMPVIFDKNDYNVTVCNPTYANYSWIPDLSIFDEYPDINTYITNNKFNIGVPKEQIINTNKRNFFCYSLMKCMPLAGQELIYNSGEYLKAYAVGEVGYTGQHIKDTTHASGYNSAFMDSYAVLKNMSTMTDITSSNENTYLFLANSITHSPTLLQTPNYVPEPEIDNAKFEAENADRFTVDGKPIDVTTSLQMRHYHVNMAMFIQLGNWFDYLRENDVFDNTKIIIVADHGETLGSSDAYKFADEDDSASAEGFYPLLMVKDFNSKGFTTSNEFMTNADVPTIAFEGTVSNPKNPFTGKPINNYEKTAHEQILINSKMWKIQENDGNTFRPAKWVSVSDNIHDKNNWKFYKEETILKEHKLP